MMFDLELTFIAEYSYGNNLDFFSFQEKIKQVFDNLIQLEHANIVKFHQYWTDAKFEKPRVSTLM